MTRTTLMTALALILAAPAFASEDRLINLGKTSPAAVQDEHSADTDFMTDEDLGATSPAVIAEEDDVISTQSPVDQNRLELLGVTSPAERAVYE